MKNTYAQAAEKMGVSVRAVRELVYAKKIGIINMGHRTKLITDSEISRVIEQRTRNAA